MFSSNVVLEELVRRSLKGLVLPESFFETSWVAGGKMSVLKDFRRLQVCSYIQNGLILKAFAFVYTTVSKNVASVFEISAVNLMVGWCEFACVMNLFDIPQRKNVVNVSFPNHWLHDTLAENLSQDRP